jgi:hypothetical protein
MRLHVPTNLHFPENVRPPVNLNVGFKSDFDQTKFDLYPIAALLEDFGYINEDFVRDYYDDVKGEGDDCSNLIAMRIRQLDLLVAMGFFRKDRENYKPNVHIFDDAEFVDVIADIRYKRSYQRMSRIEQTIYQWMLYLNYGHY